MAGRYRHRFSFYTRTETLDAYGDAALSYTLLMYQWGSLTAASAAERNDQIGTQAEMTHRIRTGWTETMAASLTAADRVTLSNRTFDIVSVLDIDGRQRELEILVREHL